MRYFLWLIAVLVALPMYAADYNESVAAISYNPSRLGSYSHLKVVNKATFTGGIDAQTNKADVNIMSSGALEITGNTDRVCTADNSSACNQIEKIGAMASEENCTSLSDLCASTDRGASLVTATSSVTQKNSLPYVETADLPDIKTSEDFPNNTGVDINMAGGDLTSDSRVFVRQLSGNLTKINLNVGTLIMNSGKTISVEGTGVSLELGDTTINSPGGNSSSQFSWQERIDDKGDKAKILAFK